jgi:hypothetical protein
VLESVAELPNLALLGLDDNTLTGSLDQIESLSKLEYAYLDDNSPVLEAAVTDCSDKLFCDCYFCCPDDDKECAFVDFVTNLDPSWETAYQRRGDFNIQVSD